MWTVVEHLSWIAGILGLVVAITGVPAFFKVAKTSGQWVMWGWTALLFAWAISVLFKWEPAVRLIDKMTRGLTGQLNRIGLSPSASWAWCFAIFGAVLGLSIFPVKMSGLLNTRLMHLLQPMIKHQQKKYGNNRQKLALQMQKLSDDFGFNPSLAIASHVLAFVICTTALLVFSDLGFTVMDSNGQLIEGLLGQVTLVVIIVLMRLGYWLLARRFANPDESMFGGWSYFFMTCVVVGIVASNFADGRLLIAVISYYAVLDGLLLVKTDRPIEVDRAKKAKWLAS